jgi:hypothetical protein
MVKPINAISKRTATHVPALKMGFDLLTLGAGADSTTVNFAFADAVRLGFAFGFGVLVVVLRAIF